MALGNAGSDTYQLDANDQAMVHEIGDLMGGLVSDEDSVQFELATDMEQLNFTRGASLARRTATRSSSPLR